MSDPLYWENMLAVCSFKEMKLSEIRIYPVDLGYGRPRAQRGRPVLADEQVGGRIIERLQRLSRRYGTEVSRQKGMGIIKV